MEKFFNALIVGKFYLFMMLFILHLQILFLGGNPMKFKFQMLALWPSKILRFKVPN
jgi:hypothetical protein